jgi:hypothetical protein
VFGTITTVFRSGLLPSLVKLKQAVQIGAGVNENGGMIGAGVNENGGMIGAGVNENGGMTSSFTIFS